MTSRPPGRPPKDSTGLRRLNTYAKLRDLLDMDYLDDLDPAEFRYLEKFVREYYGARFSDADARTDLHDRQQRRDVYRDNNARNRDMWVRWYRLELRDEREWDDDDY